MDAFGLQTSSTEADGKSVWSCSPDAAGESHMDF